MTERQWASAAGKTCDKNNFASGDMRPRQERNIYIIKAILALIILSFRIKFIIQARVESVKNNA